MKREEDERSGVQALADGLRGAKKLCLMYEITIPLVIMYQLLCAPSSALNIAGLVTILSSAAVVHNSAARGLSALEQICERLGLPL